MDDQLKGVMDMVAFTGASLRALGRVRGGREVQRRTASWRAAAGPPRPRRRDARQEDESDWEGDRGRQWPRGRNESKPSGRGGAPRAFPDPGNQQRGQDQTRSGDRKYREQTPNQSRDQCRDHRRDQPRNQFRDQRRDQPRDQSRDQRRDQPRDQYRDQYREQRRDQPSEQWRRDQPREPYHRDRGDYHRQQPEDLTELQVAMRSGNDLVFGTNPVLAALESQRRQNMTALWVAEAARGRGQDEARRILQLAEGMELPVKTRSKGDLNALSENRPHQGFVLEASPLSFEPITGLEATERSCLWLALDEITDPMNFGALVRSAVFLGCAGIAVAEKNCCPITPTASKASSGALEIAPVHAARNLPAFLESSAENGWRILGAHVHSTASPVKELALDRPTVLVVGSEGTGLRTNVSRRSTLLHIRFQQPL